MLTFRPKLVLHLEHHEDLETLQKQNQVDCVPPKPRKCQLLVQKNID